jgi:hypothetical protein
MEWRKFRAACLNKQWIYLIGWSPHRFAWGTSTGATDRLRKSSVFNPKLTGKYDRRVDYMMLKFIHVPPRVVVFETLAAPTIAERQLRTMCGQNHCWIGFDGPDRSDVSKQIVAEFKQTSHYERLSPSDKSDFEEFLEEVYFASRWIPGANGRRRTFYWGDSLEPKFLRRIGEGHLEPALERVLGVQF